MMTSFAVRELGKLVWSSGARALRAAYYRLWFGRSGGVARVLAAWMAAWEQHRWKREVPLSKELWDADYASGRWAYLRTQAQLGRYSVLAGYLADLGSDGAVLDVGCGEAILFDRLHGSRIGRFVGVDISAEAIRTARIRAADQATFTCADAEHYVPAEQFDAIVFNESLYYFEAPIETADRYTSALRPGGVMLVSTFNRSPRARAILRALKSKYPVVDETTVARGKKSWTVTVLAPPARITV